MPDGHDSGGVYYVKDVPEIRYEQGMFHACFNIGPVEFEFVMRPSVFFRALADSTEVAREHGGRKNVHDIHAATGKSSK